MAIKPMPLTGRRIRVEHVMGTVVSIDVRDPEVADSAIDLALKWFHEVDDRFSTFKPQSEISRLGRGELTLDECHVDVAEVLEICEALRVQSGGAFNAWGARTDGRLDPSGVVKGWSVDRAAQMLEAAGGRNFCINAGGDVLARGLPELGRKWRIGIRHPADSASVAAVVGIVDLAVATSGTYERGQHILDGRTGERANGWLSLTLVGPTMTGADAYATAAFAMGEAGLSWAATREGYAAYGISLNGRARYSDAFARLLAA